MVAWGPNEGGRLSPALEFTPAWRFAALASGKGQRLSPLSGSRPASGEIGRRPVSERGTIGDGGLAIVTGLLEPQCPQGAWFMLRRGYKLKYGGTIWQVVSLAQLSMSCIPAAWYACEQSLSQAHLENSSLLSAHKGADGAIPCLNGNLMWVLHWFGYDQHVVVCSACERLPEAALSQGFRCRHNARTVGDFRR